MNTQDSNKTPTSSLRRGPLLWAALLATVALAGPAAAQLSGQWDIVTDEDCTDADGQTDHESEALSIIVTQTGNRLSGSVILPEEAPPEGCSVTCSPSTPNCGQRLDLTGTVSGNSVDVTISSSQLLTADCNICAGQCVHCVFHDNTQTTAHLHGTVSGSTISGTGTGGVQDTCGVSGDPVCEGLIECTGSTCSGTFQAIIAGGPTPTPTSTPTPNPTPTVACTGDCDGSGDVTISEIITMVNIALGSGPLSDCTAGDVDGNGAIEVNEIVAAVNSALNGCPRLGKTCAGIASLPCGPGEACDLRDPTCAIVDLGGVCVDKPGACLAVYLPVCGCNGITYSNDCQRLLAGAVLRHDGACAEGGK